MRNYYVVDGHEPHGVDLAKYREAMGYPAQPPFDAVTISRREFRELSARSDRSQELQDGMDIAIALSLRLVHEQNEALARIAELEKQVAELSARHGAAREVQTGSSSRPSETPRAEAFPHPGAVPQCATDGYYWFRVPEDGEATFIAKLDRGKWYLCGIREPIPAARMLRQAMMIGAVECHSALRR